MRFVIEVGSSEKHRIEFSFNQLMGRSLVKVDGAVVFKKKRWFSEPIKDLYEIEVGQLEPVRLRIEKIRKRLVASKYLVYVNNRLTQMYQGA